MPSRTKNECMRYLAHRHYQIDEDIQEIFPILSQDDENPREAIKLLEVNRSTLASGIVPIEFGPSGTIPFPVTIVEVTPEELHKVQSSDPEYQLPNGWSISLESIPRP